MSDMPANVAQASGHPALVDADGCVWIDIGHGWSYLSTHTEVSWDVHDTLPTMYGPYRPLDSAATAVVLRAAGQWAVRR